MKKILFVLLVSFTVLIAGCAARLSEDDRNLDYYNTVYRGRHTHNFIVLNNKLNSVLENQELIIKNQEEIMKMLKGDK